jgi:hypothetical protein
MLNALSDLLSWRQKVLADLLRGRRLWSRAAGLLGLMIAGAATYGGAVLGMWHGPRWRLLRHQVPAGAAADDGDHHRVQLFTATLLGYPLKGQVIVLNLLALGAAATLLASLAPVAWLFTFAAPPPGTGERTTHNVLYLMHTALVAGCGLSGMWLLWIALRHTKRPLSVTGPVFAIWIVTYALVGGEVAWALRPFVGSVSPDFPVVFLRPDALHGNVYEFIWTDILPHLTGAR